MGIATVMEVRMQSTIIENDLFRKIILFNSGSLLERNIKDRRSEGAVKKQMSLLWPHCVYAALITC